MSAPELATLPAAAPADVEASHKFRWHLSDIARQSSISLAGTVFTVVVGYAFRIYLARELGARLLGWNALGMAVYAACKLAGETGLPAAALRFTGVYSTRGDGRELSVFFWRGLFWTVAGTASLCAAVVLSRNWIATRVFHDPGLRAYLPLYAALIPIGAGTTFLIQTLCGLKMVSRSTVIVKFASFPLMIGATAIALVFGFSLRGYVAAQIAGECVTLALAAWTLRRTLPIQLRWQDVTRQNLPNEVRWFAASMMGMGVLGFVGGHADRLILGYFLSAKQVGIYAIASSAAALNAIFLQSVNSIFGPTIASLHDQGEHALLLRLYQTLTKWILALTLPVVLTFLVFARTVMGVFGPDFQAGWLVLVIVTVGELINCATGSVGYLLIMSGNERWLVRVRLVSAVVLTAANILCIPKWGLAGVAIVSAAGTILSNIVYLAIVRWRLRLFPYNRSYLKLLAPVLASAGFLWFVHEKIVSGWHAIPALVVAGSLAALVLLGGFISIGLGEDDRLIVGMMKRRLSAALTG